MVFRTLATVIIIFSASAIIWTGLNWFFSYSVSYTVQPEAPKIALPERIEFPSLDILLRSRTQKERLWNCQENSCRGQAQPEDLPGGAVATDSAWFYYEENDSGDSTLKRRSTEDKTVTDILSTTDLTSPRGLFLSPDGKKLAFFRDNIHTPSQKLTELWVYEEEGGGIRLLAENLYQPDIRSNPRWNSSSNHLILLIDNGERSSKIDQLALLLVPMNPPRPVAAFSQIDWQEFTETFNSIVLDLDRTGQKLALAQQGFFGEKLIIIDREKQNDQQSLRGSLAYLQWLEGGDLLYAIQERSHFAFWRKDQQGLRLVARKPGRLTSALSDSPGGYVAFLTSGDNRIQVLQVDSGLIQSTAQVSDTMNTEVVQVLRGQDKMRSSEGAVTQALEDDELIAFIENHFEEITGEQSGQLIRILISSQQNTAYLDFRVTNKQDKRLLLTVHDAIHPEWSIHARYESVNGSWEKIEGGGKEDPEPLRLYEWEESVSRWILKQQANL